MHSELHFDFYGIAVQVKILDSNFQIVLQNLREDLEYFALEPESIAGPKPAFIQIRIEKKGKGQPSLRGIPLFRTRMCRVSSWGRDRICNYDGILVTSRREGKGRQFQVFGEAARSSEVYEVVYLALLSAVGEELDLLGYHRVHALGVHFLGKSSLILLPSGGGKSAMAVLLKEVRGVSIFSDEMPLVKNGLLYPFPLRLGLHPQVAGVLLPDSSRFRLFKRRLYSSKVLIPLEKEKVAEKSPVSLVLGGWPQSPRRLFPLRMITASKVFVFFQLSLNLVIGLGLCQMAEHMLRLDNVGRLFKIILSRSREVLVLVSSSRLDPFSVTPDAFKNANLLLSYLQQVEIEPLSAQSQVNCDVL